MLSLLLATALTAPALAQEDVFVDAAKPADAVEKPETKLSAEVGGTFATGNVEFYTINGGLTFSHKKDKNQVSAMALANTGRGIVDADGTATLSEAERSVGRVETARRYELEARYDRFVGEKTSVYGLAGGLIDPFAGYDLRTHEQVGVSRQFIKKDKLTLIGELGADYAQENYVDGADPDYLDVIAVRAMVGVGVKFNENVSLTEELEVFENVLVPEDVRVLNNFAFTTKLSDKFSIKLSHALVFDNVPAPVPDIRKLDQTSMVTLVASIL
jgi:putative salt-induced outer membrane protein YdiY